MSREGGFLYGWANHVAIVPEGQYEEVIRFREADTICKILESEMVLGADSKDLFPKFHEICTAINEESRRINMEKP